MEVHEDGFRPGGVLRRQGHPRAAKRRACCSGGRPHRRRAPQRSAERQHDRPRHEGEQGRDASACWRRSSCTSRRITRASGRSSSERAEAIRDSAAAVAGVKAEVFVPEVANHVPHVRVSWDAAATPRRRRPSCRRCATASRRSPSARKDRALVIGVWMMRPGEDKIVARRLRQVLEKRTCPEPCSCAFSREDTSLTRRSSFAPASARYRGGLAACFLATGRHRRAGAQPQTAQFDLLIRNGHVIDPATALDAVMDVAVAGRQDRRASAPTIDAAQAGASSMRRASTSCPGSSTSTRMCSSAPSRTHT